MAYRLTVSDRAIREIGEAYEWYEEHRVGLRFDEACQFLDFPEHCALLQRQIDLRKLALNLRNRGQRKGANPNG
jgi:hypothetical protein